MLAAHVRTHRTHEVLSLGLAQQGIVQDLGCHGAQGFHFGRPEPAAAATEALTADASLSTAT